jgi:nucleoside-diphosphate-sugar epimerase
MYSVDVLQPEQLAAALDGVTHMVNCSRGPADVMIRGLENVLRQCKASGVRRVVHLSSVAAYGDVAPPREIDEDYPARPAPRTYGAPKLRQDEIVARYADRGLPAVVLCPPNISGPYSPFLLDILQSLRRGNLALVDGGQLPCELVDVENLVHAIRLALDAPRAADGRRIFVTDVHPLSWRTLTERLIPLVDGEVSVPSIPGKDARRLLPEVPGRTGSLGRALRHLLSSEVRAALRKDPWFAATEARAKAALRRLAPSIARRLADRAAAASGTPTIRSGLRRDARLLAQQLRGVRYSTARARHLLAYEPLVGFDDSFRAFERWYHAVVGWQDESWPLVRELYR